MIFAAIISTVLAILTMISIVNGTQFWQTLTDGMSSKQHNALAILIYLGLGLIYFVFLSMFLV